MSKGKLLSKFNIFKKKKRISRETLRSNSTTECHNNNNMETIPELVRGNTVPVTSRDSSESNVYSNKRKNISVSSVEDIDKKKKQPYLGPDQASSSDCPIPTPAPSATTSSVCHNISTIEINKKEKNRSSSPVSMCIDENEPEVIASTSNSSNNQKNEKMKELEEDNESIDNSPKINVSTISNGNVTPSTSTTNNKNKNKNLETPPHTPTIFITSKSTISSIDADDVNGDGNDANAGVNSNINEIKTGVDEFDLYVEDIFNKLALDTNLTTEADTEESPNRNNRAATEHYNPGEHLTTESLTPIQSSNNLTNIPNQPQQSIPSTLRTSQTNDITTSNDVNNNNNVVNTLNNNVKKEAFNNDTLKKNNENKKEKFIEEDSSSRDKENKTNDNKAKNNDIEKYLEKETTHSVSESLEVLNNTVEMLKCGICLDILLDPKIVEPCGHSFCNHCLRLLQTRVCPLCRTRIHE
ncbi:hypothetical protein PIROE2DRAFT_68468 [Piromyces sp. E2]|nr:hypothetical protein PIROE2DRAFT_68468 [Piromyces sp. E2]|eukprot:OUM70058.1 hypothetical protein PIROE2DRAFT_68468 [Piromyces sp. E2]